MNATRSELSDQLRLGIYAPAARGFKGRKGIFLERVKRGSFVADSDPFALTFPLLA